MRIWHAIALLLMGTASAASPPAQNYRVEVLVPGSQFHGVHGLAVDTQGRLLAGSVVGQGIYEVDRATGSARLMIGAPLGEADDIAIAPDGTMAWTAFTPGDVYARKGDGPIRRLAAGLPGINSLAYTADGRLFASRVFIGDELYEIDTAGDRPARKVMEQLGGLNGFEFGPDGMLYGPLWFKGQVVKIDVERAALTPVATGFATPAAVNFDAHGNLYVVDTARGELVRVDVDSGKKELVAQLQPSLDNLAFDKSSGSIFVSNMADNGIQEIHPGTGRVRQITKSPLVLTGGIALFRDGDEETLYVADVFAFRAVDTNDGSVTDLARMHADPTRYPPLEHPFNVSANARHVILSSWYNGAVQIFDRKGKTSKSLWHGFKQPQDAVELADGSILVAEFGTGRLLRVSGADGTQRQVIAENLSGPVGLALRNDHVLVSEAIGGRITEINIASGRTRVIAAGLDQPEGIALAPGGAVLIAEVGKKRIVRIEPSSGARSIIASDLPLGLAAPPGQPVTYAPTGVAISPSGTIYVSSDIENAIYRIVPARVP